MNTNGSKEDKEKEQEHPLANEDTTDEFLDDLKKSLSEQVNETITEEGKASYNNNDPKHKKRGQTVPSANKKHKKILKYVILPVVVLFVIALVLVKTDFGKSLIIRLIGEYSYGKLDYEAGEKEPTGEELPPDTEGNNNSDKEAVEEATVSNILLIGVETFEGAQNTDTMIIASLDKKSRVIKLTSLMRDLYVTIPGYKNNKLNAAYANGGIQLLYDTIETNFGIKLDGYVLVDFNDFEQIIDYLGGIDLELTRTEAQYLRTTNYISNPAYRNVVAGVQHMNGNQVLGYCRIRKVPTETEGSDFGRTQRQRIVLEKIFEKLRKKNVIQLGLIMNNIITNIDIKTDITKEAYNKYLQQAVYLEKNAIKSYRVPMDNSYNSEWVQIGRYKQEVLVPKSWDDTRRKLREFIYGNSSD